MRSKNIKVTPEVFAQVKSLCRSGAFNQKEISEMTGISRGSVACIARFDTIEEMRAFQTAASKLTRKRRAEREESNKEAAEMYAKALEEEKNKREPIGDCYRSPEPDEDLSLKIDILDEKLGTIIELLKQIRIAQTNPASVMLSDIPTVKKPF